MVSFLLVERSVVSEESPLVWVSPPPPPLFSVVERSVVSFLLVERSVVSFSLVERSEFSMVKVWLETVVMVLLVAVSPWWEPVRTSRYSPSAASVGAGRLPTRLPLASTVSSPRV